jgi:hypothetical protein
MLLLLLLLTAAWDRLYDVPVFATALLLYLRAAGGAAAAPWAMAHETELRA